MSNRAETNSTNKRICCGFCGKSNDQVEKLIAGSGVFICDGCLKECDELLKAENNKSGNHLDGNDKCSFCSKTRTNVKSLLMGPEKYICYECIELCHILLDDKEWSDVETVNIELT